MNFKSIPKNIIKSEMKRRGVCVKKMVNLLNERGEKLTIQSFNNKIYRCSFDAIFFLKCLKALEVKNIEIDIYDDPIENCNNINKNVIKNANR